MSATALNVATLDQPPQSTQDSALQEQEHELLTINSSFSVTQHDKEVDNIVKQLSEQTQKSKSSLQQTDATKTSASADNNPSSHATTTPTNKVIQRLQRRLNTAEDKFDVHKYSSLSYVISSTLIVATGLGNGFTEIPDILQGPTWIFLISSFFQGITSIDMSNKFRTGDPLVQRGFINLAWLMLFFGWAQMYLSPFAPSAIFDNMILGKGILGALLVPSAYLGVEDMMELSDIVNGRKLRNNEKGGDLGYIADILSYTANPIAGFLLSVAGIVLISDPSHDRSWLFSNTNQLPNGELFIPYSYYANMISSMAGAYGALAITLRDKKIISKSVEQIVLGTGVVFTLAGYLKNFGAI